MLPIMKHWDCVSVLVTSAEVCVTAVLRVAQMGQGQSEDLLHLRDKQTKTEEILNKCAFYICLACDRVKHSFGQLVGGPSELTHTSAHWSFPGCLVNKKPIGDIVCCNEM